VFESRECLGSEKAVDARSADPELSRYGRVADTVGHQALISGVLAFAVGFLPLYFPAALALAMPSH
jgi:hypothetical protein